ncbi:vitamin-K epoxide reductase [Lycorma delicatula]|uniref:vitamin-K epoxide reductase n=1 Tax=Lycorma delicatula TaxID=130591 RepID=UPI003F51A05C
MYRGDLVNLSIRLSCFIGFCLSYYSYFVETRMEHDKSYTPICDISPHMSCSRAFLSEYGKGFGLVNAVLGNDSVLNKPNGVIGCIFYALFFILSFWNKYAVIITLMVLASLSNFASAYLAAVLYFALYDACVVCISTYVINAVLLLLASQKLKSFKIKNTKLL